MHFETVKMGQMDQQVCTLSQNGTDGPTGMHTETARVGQRD